MRFTVFTPTYNRAYTLERLYHSLQRQTFRDFEWLVIDDGSTDNTYELFEQWKRDSRDFDITYIKAENGGKHRAINRGVKLAKGEMFFIADSDDYLADNALELVDFVEKSIPEDEKHHFAGVCGQDGYDLNTPIGTTFTGQRYLDITSMERPRYAINGDKKEVFYTDVVRAFPFPEFEGEKFVTESVVWNRISKAGYRLRFFNEVIYLVEYQEGGISNNLDNILKNSPRGWALSINEDIKNHCAPKNRIWSIRLWYYRTMKHKMSLLQICDALKVCPIAILFLMGKYYLKIIFSRLLLKGR